MSSHNLRSVTIERLQEKLNAAALKIQARYREYLRHRLLRLEDRWKQLLQRFTYSPKNEARSQESIAGINYQSAQVPSGKVAHKQKHVTWRGKHTAGGASTDMKPQAVQSQIIPTNGWHYISLLMPRHLHHHHQQRQKEWRSQAQTIHNDAQEKFVPYPQTKGLSSHVWYSPIKDLLLSSLAFSWVLIPLFTAVLPLVWLMMAAHSTAYECQRDYLEIS